MTLLEEFGRGALDVLMLVQPAANAKIETIRLFDDSFLLVVPATDRRKGPGFSSEIRSGGVGGSDLEHLVQLRMVAEGRWPLKRALFALKVR